MADEELVPEGDEAPESAPEEQTDDPVAKIASEMGWVPQDQFRGEPEKWKPADQFIRDGREIQQATARELRAMREQVERIGGVTETIIRDKVAERDAYWRDQHKLAVKDGDEELADRALEELRKPAPIQPQGGDPTVSAWVEKNAWFNSDPLAQARAKELSDRLKHLPVPDQLTQVERAIRKEFPEHFSPPVKPPPATQTGQNRSAAPGNRQKGFADMPAESQKMALDFEERLGVPRESTAQKYWIQEGVKR